MAEKNIYGEVRSEKEVALIQELVKTRMETDRKLDFESFEGYELPPRSQFSMLKKPTITIRHGRFCCNMAAIRLFKDVRYVLPMVNATKKRFAIVPCPEEENASVEWSRKKKKNGMWVNKDIVSIDFTEKIFKLMGWNRECRYKVHGRLTDSERGLILVFDLEEAIMFGPKAEEYTDPVTGKVKKRQVKYYPDFYKDRIGRSYNDYAAARQMEQFESTECYEDAAQFGEVNNKETAGDVKPKATTESYSEESSNVDGSVIDHNFFRDDDFSDYAEGSGTRSFQSENHHKTDEVMAYAK